MADQRAQHAGVANQRHPWTIQRIGKTDDAPLQIGDRLASGRRKTGHIRRPGVDCLALNIVPALPLPFAKIDFGQALVNEHLIAIAREHGGQIVLREPAPEAGQGPEPGAIFDVLLPLPERTTR